MRNTCKFDGCDIYVTAQGYCNAHYQRWRRHGDPRIVKANFGNRTPRPVPSIRKCNTCGGVGPSEDFKPKTNLCKPCGRKRSQAWKDRNPERVAASRERSRKSPLRLRYQLRRRAVVIGLNPDEVERYYDAHDGRCEICGQPPRPGGRDLNLDHDHDTGAFRGLLCNNCNNGLGRFKDSVVNLDAAVTYLKRYGRGEG